MWWIIGLGFLATAVVIISAAYAKSPERKGKRGEKRVAGILGETVEGEQYVVNDLMFKAENGQTCQIDHVFINSHGVWVIETKNYSGTICGDSDSRQWTQILAGGKVKNSFYNPVKQNKTHIYRLSEYLGEKNVFINVVCFPKSANMVGVSAENVYTFSTLKYIRTRETGIRLSAEKMKEYYDKLVKLKEESGVTKEEHLHNIKKMQDGLERGICPRCGGKLVVRKGKYGEFLGCSNYPECKFKKKL